jgi:hypothetical protein
MCVHSKYFSFNEGTCCNKGLLKLIPYSSTSFSSLFSSRFAAAVFTSSYDAHALNPPIAAKHVSDSSLIRSTDAHKSSSEEDESLLLLLDVVVVAVAAAVVMSSSLLAELRGR